MTVQLSNNRALNGAIRKGREAYRAGLSEADCPYRDHRKKDGRLTWSRAFQTAWIDGFRDEQNCQSDKDSMR